jgi:hypothetical protein
METRQGRITIKVAFAVVRETITPTLSRGREREKVLNALHQ